MSEDMFIPTEDIDAVSETLDVLMEEQCQMCGGPGQYMGRLGHLHWFRCQDCGMEFNYREDR